MFGCSMKKVEKEIGKDWYYPDHIPVHLAPSSAHCLAKVHMRTNANPLKNLWSWKGWKKPWCDSVSLLCSRRLPEFSTLPHLFNRPSQPSIRQFICYSLMFLYIEVTSISFIQHTKSSFSSSFQKIGILCHVFPRNDDLLTFCVHMCTKACPSTTSSGCPSGQRWRSDWHYYPESHHKHG